LIHHNRHYRAVIRLNDCPRQAEPVFKVRHFFDKARMRPVCPLPCIEKKGNESMSQYKKLFVVSIIVFMSVSGLAKQSSSADESAIKQIVQQVQDAWNAHDGKAFAAPFAPDADYVVVNGMKIKGREAIEKGHIQIFTTIYKDSHNLGTVKSIRFLRPDVAVVHIEWNLEVRPGGEKGQAMNTMVMTKENGKWHIAAFHNTPVPAQGR
jgi:uncharacterized protein (TIGR02246 family)